MRKILLLALAALLSLTGRTQHPVLFPIPRLVQYGTGQLPLSALSVNVPPGETPAIRFALNELKQLIKQRLGLPSFTPSRPAAGTSTAVSRPAAASQTAFATTGPAATLQYTVRTPGLEVPGAHERSGDREKYSLHIDTRGIRIEAATSAGLYYAVQTIRQLITGQGRQAALPVLELEDQPALAYRGVMMDFAHGGLLTTGEIKRQIDFLAGWKTNQYYFYNEVSIAFKGYASLNYQASYTQAQIREIIAYARERHMDVIPFVAFYGHLHDLLKQEKYASLAIGKYGEELDPRNPQVQVVLRDWIQQYTQLFSSPFVHVGFDETWETNRISMDVDSSIHSEQLWLQHLDFVQKEWRRYGKTVLAWTDMNSYYPDILSKFPREVIPVIWEYAPDTSAIGHYLNPVLKEKREFFIQPAVSGWGHIYPEADYTYDNIDLCLKAGMAHQTLGFITSVWTDAVEPFVRPSWMFMAYGCIAAWQGRTPDKTSFTGAYSGLVYPSVGNEISQALSGLAATIATLTKCMGNNTSNLPGGTIIESWSNPFESYYLANTQTHLADFREARKQSEEVEEILIGALDKLGGLGISAATRADSGSIRADSAFITSLLVSARLLHYTATRFLLARAICDRWNEAMLGKKKNDFVYYDIAYICHGLIQDVMDEGGEIKTAYAGAWLSEYMPYRLNTMLGRFDVEYGLWQKLLLKVLDYRIQHERSHVATQPFEDLFKPEF